MAVEVGTILTTSSGCGKTRLEVRSLHKLRYGPHHHHAHHHHHHGGHLAQRAGAGLAQGRVVKPVKGDQAVHELSPGRHHGDAGDHSHHGGDDGVDRGGGDDHHCHQHA